MMQILEKENMLLEECRYYSGGGRKLYIYGSGMAGRMVLEALKMHGISAEGFCVDADYYEQGMSCCGLPVVSIDELKSRNENGKIAAAAAFMSAGKRNWSACGVKIIDRDFWSLGTIYNYADNRMDSEYVQKHTDRLNWLYDRLEDEKSRKCMEAFINQRISGKFEYLEALYGTEQYYEQELFDIRSISCMADCGAYDGDSFRSFCINYEKAAGRPYGGTAFLLEPDRESFCRLSEAYSGRRGIVLLNAGAWDKKETLAFQAAGMSGSVSEDGGASIAADSLDHLISGAGKVDFIKMDIEGSELKALRGAQAIVKRDHPVLAVCVYHKKEDLVTIPQYIESMHAGYRLYLRAYSRYCQELVLYAVSDSQRQTVR